MCCLTPIPKLCEPRDPAPHFCLLPGERVRAARGSMGSLGGTSPEEIEPLSLTQAVSGWPKSSRKTSSCPGSSVMWHCLLGSHRGWVRFALWASPVATAGSPWGAGAFPCPILCPGPCPGAGSPWGIWEDPPLPPGFKEGWKPQQHGQRDTQSADAHGQKEA